MKSEIIIGSKHSWATRLFHGLLALAISLQLLTSLIMQGPDKDDPGDWLFQLHEYSGLTAFSFALCFWVILASRKIGTDVKSLFPWFIGERRSALWLDTKSHFTALKSFKIPAYTEDGPLSSAVHGLGLLLITAMGATGSLFFFALSIGAQRSAFFEIDLEVHALLANLVWAYFIGHAGVALFYHYLQQFSIREMWSLRREDHRATVL